MRIWDSSIAVRLSLPSPRCSLKAKCSDSTQRPHATFSPLRDMGLIGILDDDQPVPLAQPAYRGVPGGIVTACLGCVGAAFMLALSLYHPYAASKRGSFPPEWTILL